MAVDAATQSIASSDIRIGGGAQGVARYLQGQRVPLKVDKGCACFEPELGVEGQRPPMICGLDEAYPRLAPLGRPLECSLHELTAKHAVLDSGIHRDRPHTDNCGTLVQGIASNDATAQLRDDHVVAGMRQPFCETGHSDVRRWKVRGKAMFLCNHFESFIADRPTLLGIVRGA
jgi:hypothetical protein